MSVALPGLSALWPNRYIINGAIDKATHKRQCFAELPSRRKLPAHLRADRGNARGLIKEEQASNRMSADNNDQQLQENVVERLKTRIRQARASGFVVRQELLGPHQSTWCEIGGRKMLFLDAAQPAREQIATIDEVMADYRASVSRKSTVISQLDG